MSNKALWVKIRSSLDPNCLKLCLFMSYANLIMQWSIDNATDAWSRICSGRFMQVVVQYRSIQVNNATENICRSFLQHSWPSWNDHLSQVLHFFCGILSGGYRFDVKNYGRGALQESYPSLLTEIKQPHAWNNYYPFHCVQPEWRSIGKQFRSEWDDSASNCEPSRQ